MQSRTDRPIFISYLVRSAHLTNDLQLTQHHGIQPGSHHQHVFSSSIGVTDIKISAQSFNIYATCLMENLHHIINTSMETASDGVDLQAVTRRDNEGFA